jgi:lysozyme
MPEPMRPSPRCVAYVKEIETLVSPARHLPADVITGGYGETSRLLVSDGMIVTEALADAWLDARMAAVSDSVVRMCEGCDLTQGRFDALFSFVYNEGLGTFSRSSILVHLRAGEVERAADSLLLYDVADGRALAGLETRREVERGWFLEA